MQLVQLTPNVSVPLLQSHSQTFSIGLLPVCIYKGELQGRFHHVSGRQRVDTLGGAVSSWEALLLSVYMVVLIQLVNLVPSGLIETKMVRCNDQTLPFKSVYLTALQVMKSLGFPPSVLTYWKRSNTGRDQILGTITAVLHGIIPPILSSRHSCRSHSHQRLQRTRAKQK